MSEESSSIVVRDALLRGIQDVLADAAEKIQALPEGCRNCPVYTAMSGFAAKLRRAAVQEEGEIVRLVRERYGI